MQEEERGGEVLTLLGGPLLIQGTVPSQGHDTTWDTWPNWSDPWFNDSLS